MKCVQQIFEIDSLVHAQRFFSSVAQLEGMIESPSYQQINR